MYLQDNLLACGVDPAKIDAYFSAKPEYVSHSKLMKMVRDWYEPEGIEYFEKLLSGSLREQLKAMLDQAQEGAKTRIINGLLVREHPEIPGLFNITDIWKSAREYFPKEGSWKAKRPMKWQRKTIKIVIADLQIQIEPKHSSLWEKSQL
jgi:hypothetical protein